MREGIGKRDSIDHGKPGLLGQTLESDLQPGVRKRKCARDTQKFEGHIKTSLVETCKAGEGKLRAHSGSERNKSSWNGGDVVEQRVMKGNEIREGIKVKKEDFVIRIQSPTSSNISKIHLFRESGVASIPCSVSQSPPPRRKRATKYHQGIFLLHYGTYRLSFLPLNRTVD